MFTNIFQLKKKTNFLLVQNDFFFSVEKINTSTYYVILVKKICENKIHRFVVWSDEPITYFKFKIFVNRMSKLGIMLELVGLLTLVWIANFVIMAKRSFAWMETWKQPLVNFCMAGSKLIMENIHTEVNLTKVVVI